MNIRINIEYDGEGYFGWQRQPGLPTIQGTIEKALKKITGEFINVCGAGRTDTGVHAFGQVGSFHTDFPVPDTKWWKVLNQYLPNTIRITGSCKVADVFHAQRSASSKIYEYRILNSRVPTALDRMQLFCPTPLDMEKIRTALPQFVGTHDFKAFQSSGGTVKTTVRELYSFDLFDEGRGRYRFVLEGSGFLKQMVRNIMGTVLEVGEGKRSPDDIARILASRRRQEAGRTVPACGLCLVTVKYPEPYQMPDRLLH